MATAVASGDPPDALGLPSCKCFHNDKHFLVSPMDLISRKDVAEFFKLDPATVRINSRLMLSDAPVTVGLLEEDGMLRVEGDPAPMPVVVRVAVVRGIATVITGLAMAAAVAYLGKALGKGIGTTGTALGRGLSRTGAALGRGLGVTGVALGQGISDLGTSVKDGVKDINVGVRVGVGGPGNEEKKEEEKKEDEKKEEDKKE